MWRAEQNLAGDTTVIGPGTDFFTIRPGIGQPTGEVVAMSKATGRITWRAPYQGIGAFLAADDHHLFVSVGAGGGRLLAFDIDGCGLATCPPVWTASGGVGEPIVGGDVVYVEGPDGAIEAYDADGCGLATCPPLSSLSVPSATHMTVGEGHLLVASPTATAGTYEITALAPTSP